MMVSVIIPAYNCERTIGEAVESVVSQTYSDLEIIVVDDGSTDGTAAQVAAIRDARVRCAYQPNQGAGAARNHGVKLASHDLIAFLDADDVWTPDKLTLQVNTLTASPDLDMVFGHYVQFGESGDSAPMEGCSTCTLLVRRAAFLAVGGFSSEWRVGEFIDWYARAKDYGLRDAMLPQVVLRRRIHADNMGRRAADARADYARVLGAIIRRRQITTPAGK